MDIPRPGNLRKKRLRQGGIAAAGALVLAASTVGLSRLEPAAPSVERASVWIDTVKQGQMLREVRGPGTLEPHEIRWIPAQTDARVERILVRPGAVVKPDTVIVEMSNGDLLQKSEAAKFALEAAKADLAEKKIQLQGQQLDQRATIAEVESQYKSAKLQAEAERPLANEGIVPGIQFKRSELDAEQYKTRLGIEKQRLAQSASLIDAQLASQQAKVDQAESAYDRLLEQVDSLRVRAGLAGVLQQMLVQAGQRVTIGANIASVARPDDLQAELQIPETQARDVQLGQKVSVDTRNGIVEGRVARIDPSVQGGTVQVDVRAHGQAAARRASGPLRRRHGRNRAPVECRLYRPPGARAGEFDDQPVQARRRGQVRGARARAARPNVRELRRDRQGSLAGRSSHSFRYVGLGRSRPRTARLTPKGRPESHTKNTRTAIMSADAGPLIKLEDLKKVFYTDEVETHALSGVHFDINEGDYVSIAGPSGCGKSTLLSIVGLLDTPSGGRYWLNGTSVEDLDRSQRAKIRNREIGFVFQAFNLIGDLTVFENVELPLTYRSGVSAQERKQRVIEALERVRMAHRLRHYPSQLSGGQQQRVAVARALVGKPSILLADEPTGNLDSKNGEAVMGLLTELHAEGATICMVTHDPRYAAYADREIHMFDGRIVDEETLNRLREEEDQRIAEQARRGRVATT